MTLHSCLALAVRFLRATGGATSIEYAIIGALVACGVIVGATALGVKLNVVYTGLSGSVPDAP